MANVNARLWSYSKFDRTRVAFMESMTSPPCFELIRQARIDVSAPKTLLDNACGGGVLTDGLYKILGAENAAKVEVVCGDLSEGMVELADTRIKAEGWNATAKVVDAQNIALPEAHFDYVLTNFGIQLMPEPTKAFQETFRVLKPRGVIGFTNWTKVGWLPFVPGFPMKEMVLADPSVLESELTKIGFVDIKILSKVYEARFANRHLVVKEMKNMMAGGMGEEMATAMDKAFEESFGEGEVFWSSGALTVTGTKP